jgi:acetyl-CoA carboxylase biotin carboxylase subunit
MNTRIQVEHPVTEMVTGIDLVQEQLRIADGRGLSFRQEDVTLRGAAIEVRVNAEDPAQAFMPSPGEITTFEPPEGAGIRVDTAAFPGYRVPPFYDSLIAKLIVRGKDRAETLARARRALEQFVIEGVKTSIPLHRQIVANEKFIAGDFSTKFMETFLRG